MGTVKMLGTKVSSTKFPEYLFDGCEVEFVNVFGTLKFFAACDD